MYTRQWRRKSLYQKLLFAWLRTFWQMLLHFYDRIVTQVMYKNMYITTLLPTGHPASLWEMFSFFWLRFAIWPYDDYDIIQSYISQVLSKLEWIVCIFVVVMIWPLGQIAADWPIKMSKIQAKFFKGCKHHA